ncbi:MAG TPA: serine/threonine-protein kinase [Pyrinomonadaceae bacterium]|nr:serine/threonine-protein kinase [Pyrinomonadaceae bacterium]
MKTCPACGKEYEDANTLCPADGAVLKKSEGDDPLVGQVLAGKYRIEEKIDEGGMGCVYRATHVLMEKTVAVKVLHPALAADEKIVARFTREAKAASRISHPHAIVVTDFGESEQGVVYLVMEYLRGRTLKEVVRTEGPMPLARVSEIVRQVSGALDAAHEQGVVHRDLKSDNIMLEETAGGDWAKVLDFGIAKIQEETGKTDPGLTAPNLIIGTPQYMSPEQCGQASAIDQRSDIYSFGIILYEMLAGHVPFTGESPTAIMMKHIQEPPPSILEERPDLPAGVGRVVARALAKRPEDRFQRASELPDALALAAAEEAVEVPVPVAASDTNRIVVPTAPNEPPRTTTVVDDEATVVSAEMSRTPTDERLPPPVAPVPAADFNPWRIALPAIAALAVVFAVFFAYQRLGASNEPAQPPLNADPNSQPAQPVAPPSGQAETNLAPASTPTPTSPTTPGDAPLTTADPGSFQTEGSASPTPAASPQGRAGGENANQRPRDEATPEEGGEEEEEEEPEPEPTPRTRRTPNANVTVPTGEPPPPPRPRPESSPAEQLGDPEPPAVPSR